MHGKNIKLFLPLEIDILVSFFLSGDVIAFEKSTPSVRQHHTIELKPESDSSIEDNEEICLSISLQYNILSR